MDVQLPEDLGRVQQMGVVDNLLDIPGDEWQVQNQWQPVSVDQEEERQETVYGSLGDDVGVQAVAEVDGVDVVTATGTLSALVSSRGDQVRGEATANSCSLASPSRGDFMTYHSKSLYMIVKKTCKNRFTAFISTANRNSHASPDILSVD